MERETEPLSDRPVLIGKPPLPIAAACLARSRAVSLTELEFGARQMYERHEVSFLKSGLPVFVKNDPQAAASIQTQAFAGVW